MKLATLKSTSIYNSWRSWNKLTAQDYSTPRSFETRVIAQSKLKAD